MKNRVLLISLVVLLALSVGLVGCGGQETPEPTEYSLTISSTEGGSATTPGEGTFTYDEGDAVELVAEPDDCYRFINWTGNVETIADVESASSTIIMDSDTSIMANFELKDSSCDCECQQATPGGYVGYLFEQSNFSKYEIVFNWTDTPKSNDVGIYPALLHFWFESGQGGYVGPQIEVYNSGETTVKKVLFSIWSMNNEQFTAHPYCSWSIYGDTEGNFVQCMIHNNPSATTGQYHEQMWEEGKEYKITVQKDEELTDGVVWKATIEDLETGLETLIGKIKLDDQEPYKGYGLLNGYTGGFFEYYFGSDNECLEAEYGKIIRKGPFAENVDGVWLPRKGTCLHTACIRAETYSPEVGVIVEEVGEGVERSPEEPLEQVLWEFAHDIDSAHYSDLLARGVREIVSPGVPGPVYAEDPAWQVIVTGDGDTTYPSTFVMAREYGSGRVVIMGHDGLLGNLDLLDNTQFMLNTISWLDTAGGKKVLYSTGHQEWVTSQTLHQLKIELESRGYILEATAAPIADDSLAECDVLIAGHAWGSISDLEVDTVEDFVSNGGGLLLIGLGWSWLAYHPGSTMGDFPMMKLAEPYGAGWLTSYISDRTNRLTEDVDPYMSPIFHVFYPT